MNNPCSMLCGGCFAALGVAVPTSSIEQTCEFQSTMVMHGTKKWGLIMKTNYLHISAYSCDKCEGPVIAGSFGTRETEISRESDLTQIGAVCLSCGNEQTEMNAANSARQFAPIEWALPKGNRGQSFA